MPGFVKTAADEKAWDKSKKAADKSYPDLPQDRKFAVANVVFHKMKGGKDQQRTERHGNPGKEVASEQFPLAKDKSAPFNTMDPHWQGSSLDRQKQAEKFYSKGEARQLSRRIPIGPGGAGGVVSGARVSTLHPDHYQPAAKKGMR